MICGVIRRFGGLVNSKTPDRGSQIFILVAKNLKLAALMFKSIKYCSKAYDIDVSTAHLCCITSINRSWNRRIQMTLRHPNLTRTIGKRLWRT